MCHIFMFIVIFIFSATLFSSIRPCGLPCNPHTASVYGEKSTVTLFTQRVYILAVSASWKLSLMAIVLCGPFKPRWWAVLIGIPVSWVLFHAYPDLQRHTKGSVRPHADYISWELEYRRGKNAIGKDEVCYRLYGTGSWLWLHILRPGAIALTFSVLYFALNKQLPMEGGNAVMAFVRAHHLFWSGLLAMASGANALLCWTIAALDSYGRWGKATSDSLEWVRRTVGFRLFRVLFALSVLLPPALYTFRVYMRTAHAWAAGDLRVYLVFGTYFCALLTLTTLIYWAIALVIEGLLSCIASRMPRVSPSRCTSPQTQVPPEPERRPLPAHRANPLPGISYRPHLISTPPAYTPHAPFPQPPQWPPQHIPSRLISRRQPPPPRMVDDEDDEEVYDPYNLYPPMPSGSYSAPWQPQCQYTQTVYKHTF